LTEKHVCYAFTETEDIFERTEKLLGDSNEELRNAVRRAFGSVSARAQALSAPPKEVLARVKTFYDRTVELGQSGVQSDELALQLDDEFPDLMDFYGLLRLQDLKEVW